MTTADIERALSRRKLRRQMVTELSGVPAIIESDEGPLISVLQHEALRLGETIMLTGDDGNSDGAVEIAMLPDGTMVALRREVYARKRSGIHRAWSVGLNVDESDI